MPDQRPERLSDQTYLNDEAQKQALEKNTFAARRFEGRGGIGSYILGGLLVVVLWFVFTRIFFGITELAGFEAAMDLVINRVNWVDLGPEDDLNALMACAFILANLILMLLGTWIVVKLVHERRLITLVTASDHFRWGAAFKSFVIYAGVLGLVSVATLPFFPSDTKFVFDPERFFPFLALVLLLTPLQAFAEEVFVRGYLFQAVSSFTASLAARLVLPAVVFSMLHLANPDFIAGGIWAIASYFAFGLYFGWLTIKTGGVEHSTGVHTANNIVAFSVVSSAGSGMPFATLYFQPVPDYQTGFFSLILVAGLHYLITFKLLKS